MGRWKVVSSVLDKLELKVVHVDWRKNLGVINKQVVIKTILMCVQEDYSGQEEIRNMDSQGRQIFKR